MLFSNYPVWLVRSLQMNPINLWRSPQGFNSMTDLPVEPEIRSDILTSFLWAVWIHPQTENEEFVMVSESCCSLNCLLSQPSPHILSISLELSWKNPLFIQNVSIFLRFWSSFRLQSIIPSESSFSFGIIFFFCSCRMECLAFQNKRRTDSNNNLNNILTSGTNFCK